MSRKSSYKSKSKLTAVINAYKSRRHPFRPNPNYRHHLEGLMSELQELSTKPWKFDPEIGYFDYYCYLYLNPLKPGRYKYVLPSGKLISLKYEPFYTGKGQKGRAYVHLKDAEDEEVHNHKVHTIRKIWAAGKKPKIIVMGSRVSDYLAQAFEIDLIAGIGRKDLKLGPLTNLTDGGDGMSGGVHSQVTKIKISVAKLGVKLSNKTRARMSVSHAGVPLSDTHKANIGRGNKGRTIPEAQKKQQALKMTGRVQSEATIAKRVAKNTGKRRSPESLARMRAGAQNMATVECPHCEKDVRLNQKHRHFDNCSLN